jgi:hypothetical protein
MSRDDAKNRNTQAMRIWRPRGFGKTEDAAILDLKRQSGYGCANMKKRRHEAKTKKAQGERR